MTRLRRHLPLLSCRDAPLRSPETSSYPHDALHVSHLAHTPYGYVIPPPTLPRTGPYSALTGRLWRPPPAIIVGTVGTSPLMYRVHERHPPERFVPCVVLSDSTPNDIRPSGRNKGGRGGVRIRETGVSGHPNDVPNPIFLRALARAMYH